MFLLKSTLFRVKWLHCEFGFSSPALSPEIPEWSVSATLALFNCVLRGHKLPPFFNATNGIWERLPDTYSHLHDGGRGGLCSIRITCRRRRRQPFWERVPGTWNSIRRDSRNRWESGALVGMAVTGGGHRRSGRSPEGAAFSGVVRRRRRGDGPTIVRVKRWGYKAISDDGRGRRGRRRDTGSLGIVGGHAIRTGSILLVVVYHAISIPLGVVRSVRVNSPSRRRGRQRRRRVTRGYMANTASHVTRWGGLRSVPWVTRRPVAAAVWGRRRRRIGILFFMSGSTLWNLDMNAFS